MNRPKGLYCGRRPFHGDLHNHAATGGPCELEGKKPVLSVGDFHPSVIKSGHTYRLDLFREEERILSPARSPNRSLRSFRSMQNPAVVTALR